MQHWPCAGCNHDETLGLLRYAQKAAIAQRRTVCVSFPTTGSATLSIASNAPTASTPTPTCSPSSSLIGPRGESQASIPATDHGVTYNGLPVNFSGLGSYNISSVSVAVATTAESAELNAIKAKKITVNVTDPQGNTISLTGYRANYYP